MSVKTYTDIIDGLIKKSGLEVAAIDEDRDRLNSIIQAAINQYYTLVPVPILDINGHESNIPEKLRDRRAYMYTSEIIHFHGIHYITTLVKGENSYISFEDRLLFSHTSTRCTDCGAYMALNYDYDTNTLTLSEHSSMSGICKAKGIDRVHSMELDLSGGKIVIANDLRQLYGDLDEEEHAFIKANGTESIIGVNAILGRMSNTKSWATVGMMYFQSGNTSPNYYWNAKENYFVFRDCFEEWEEYDDEEPKWDELPFKIDVENEVEQGYVCTDLWAIHAMSMETFKALCAKNGFDENLRINAHDIKIHDVPPGIYTCTTYYELSNDDSMMVYHTIKLKE